MALVRAVVSAEVVVPSGTVLATATATATATVAEALVVHRHSGTADHRGSDWHGDRPLDPCLLRAHTPRPTHRPP
ncbi:hypothetical protein BIU92_02575 [Curtobacterium sp. MCBA15_003]|nr:hypothetical protein BIU92_02575 [Curtobacterium sp. MCBA15_003]OII30388.1 hypothetical protein BIU94_06315 [Curtobacterium sp. MMLR14_006]